MWEAQGKKDEGKRMKGRGRPAIGGIAGIILEV